MIPKGDDAGIDNDSGNGTMGKGGVTSGSKGVNDSDDDSGMMGNGGVMSGSKGVDDSDVDSGTMGKGGVMSGSGFMGVDDCDVEGPGRCTGSRGGPGRWTGHCGGRDSWCFRRVIGRKGTHSSGWLCVELTVRASANGLCTSFGSPGYARWQS